MLAVATVATGTGVAVVAAPVIITAPIMGMAGMAGFTPAGIAGGKSINFLFLCKLVYFIKHFCSLKTLKYQLLLHRHCKQALATLPREAFLRRCKALLLEGTAWQLWLAPRRLLEALLLVLEALAQLGLG